MDSDEEMQDFDGEPEQARKLLPPPAMLPPPSGPPAGQCTAQPVHVTPICILGYLFWPTGFVLEAQIDHTHFLPSQ